MLEVSRQERKGFKTFSRLRFILFIPKIKFFGDVQNFFGLCKCFHAHKMEVFQFEQFLRSHGRVPYNKPRYPKYTHTHEEWHLEGCLGEQENCQNWNPSPLQAWKQLNNAALPTFFVTMMSKSCSVLKEANISQGWPLWHANLWEINTQGSTCLCFRGTVG